MSEETGRKSIKWTIKPKKWKSLGELDLISQLDQGQQLINESLIKYGIFNAKGRRTMRDACMSAETCAHYYAITGDAATLEAIKAAVKAFRKYRH